MKGNLCIIPARGGSKRIPRKNIRNFHGKPIIAYSIEAALNSGLFEEVMVSTDDEEIASVATEYGAKVPFLRSNKNSDDHATTVDVILEVLQIYNQLGKDFEMATCIYACAPFVTCELLSKSLEMLTDEIDCVFPVLPYSHPIQRALKITDNGTISSYFDSDYLVRTQDYIKTYHDAGMFYSFDVKKLFINKSLHTSQTKPIEINELFAQDIDTIIDWKLAELKYKLSINEKL